MQKNYGFEQQFQFCRDILCKRFAKEDSSIFRTIQHCLDTYTGRFGILSASPPASRSLKKVCARAEPAPETAFPIC